MELVIDSFEIDLHDADVITQAESEAFVKSRGKECPKCGEHTAFVASHEGSHWYYSGDGGWGENRCDCAAIGFMCCIECHAFWYAIYTPPNMMADDSVCPICTKPESICGDSYSSFVLHDELLNGLACKPRVRPADSGSNPRQVRNRACPVLHDGLADGRQQPAAPVLLRGRAGTSSRRRHIIILLLASRSGGGSGTTPRPVVVG